MKLRSHLAIWTSIASIYVFCLLLGLGYLRLPWRRHSRPVTPQGAWQMPDMETIPPGPAGDSIRYGQQIFDSTPWVAPGYTGARVACSDCHIGGGIAPRAVPLIGATHFFPMYSKRAGHRISLKDRIQECFVRSENGHPLPYDGPEMNALVHYIAWLSQPEPAHRPFTARGLVELPLLRPNLAHGAEIYAQHCAGCHGTDGAGSRPLIPPLWGPDSFNDGAGMSRISKMARFVYANMPQNRIGILSEQDAYDVSAYIHTKPRPAFNPQYSKY